MEWKLIQNNIASISVSFLMLSIIFLLPILYTSNPNFSFMSNEIQTSGREDDEACDLSVGKWLRDLRGSLYTNLTCPTLPVLKNCLRHGKDPGFIYWRWNPDGCELLRFEPMVFLRLIRGKKLAFIGDSLARNQMESLLCLLSQAEAPVNKYMDTNERFQTWYFPSHDFTLKFMWTEFLVLGQERLVNGTKSNMFDIHLDKINTNWTNKLPGIHYAILSSGNWFFRTNYLYKDNNLIGCIFCRDETLTDLGPVYAIKNAIRTALEHIRECKYCEGLVTLLRTYSPSHFEHGSWFSGGYCNRTKPLNESEVNLYSNAEKIRKIQMEEVVRMETIEEKERRRRRRRRFVLMDVTKAMVWRADGHPGSHWLRVRDVNDCLHWCLPGPVDMWNELLLGILRRNS